MAGTKVEDTGQLVSQIASSTAQLIGVYSSSISQNPQQINSIVLDAPRTQHTGMRANTTSSNSEPPGLVEIVPVIHKSFADESNEVGKMPSPTVTL